MTAAASPTTMDPFLMLEFIKPREKLSTLGTIGRAFGGVTNDRLNSNDKIILSSSKVLKPDVIFGRYAYLREKLLVRHGAELPPQIRELFNMIDELKRRVFTNYKAVLTGIARPADLPLSIKDLIRYILRLEMEDPKSIYISDLHELRRFVYYMYDLYRAKMKERGIEIAKEDKETRRILSSMPAVPSGVVGAKSLEERLANLGKRRRGGGTRKARKTCRKTRRCRRTAA